MSTGRKGDLHFHRLPHCLVWYSAAPVTRVLSLQPRSPVFVYSSDPSILLSPHCRCTVTFRGPVFVVGENGSVDLFVGTLREIPNYGELIQSNWRASFDVPSNWRASRDSSSHWRASFDKSSDPRDLSGSRSGLGLSAYCSGLQSIALAHFGIFWPTSLWRRSLRLPHYGLWSRQGFARLAQLSR